MSGQNNNQNKPASKPFRPPRILERRPAIVREVTSGDSVVLIDVEAKVVNAPPKQINLTMQSLRAPSLGRRVMKNGKASYAADEPFAFLSREYLRKRLVGKSVVYTVGHDTGNRVYGEIFLKEENLRFTIVQKGWADISYKVKEGREPREEDLQLQALKDAAQAKGLGIWNSNQKGAVPRVNYRESQRGEVSAELFDFFEKMKGKALSGIVEQVRSGSTLRIRLTQSQDNILLLLAGIRAPTYNFSNDALSEPFSRESKFFTEHLLLNRDVTVTLQGIDKYNNFFGTVLDDKKRNISVNLLSMGLASYVDWSASTKEDRKAFPEAEALAQKKKLRIWKNFKQTKAAAGGSVKEGTKVAKVVEIINASTIAVQGTDGTVRRISLASISVPRFMRESQLAEKEGETLSEKEKEKRANDRRNSVYAFEGKELLRSKLIGKTVKCTKDYTRPGHTPKGSDKQLPPKAFWTVTSKDKNVAIDLVRQGYATVVPHGKDEARSPDFQELIVAEKQAQKAKKGLHAPVGKTPTRRVTDLSQQNATKSQTYLPSLKKGKVPAVVDYVFTGARMKCYVPSQEIMLSFALQGVMADRVARAEKPKSKEVADMYPADSFGNKALHFTRARLLQRDVELEIEAADKGGNFLGTLYVGGIAYGEELISNGLAKVHERSAERIRQGPRLLQALELAKNNRAGMWFDYDPAVEAARLKAEAEAREEAYLAKEAASKVNITVTDILDGGNFWFQTVGEQTEALESMMENFATQDFGSEPYAAAKKGELVSALFSVDSNWYRAEILKVKPAKAEGEIAEYTVIFVDYGNVEVVTADSLRPIAEDFSYKILPKQAQHGRLAMIRAPTLEKDYGEEAAALLKELVWGKPLVATIQFKEENVSYMSLGDPETKVPINAALVMAGLARVQKSRSKSAFVDRLRDEEQKARKARLALWAYGDNDDSGDEY
eukprot:TRINITY_DN1442_c0_g1_i1.p1 TRINITY_DN1442_c0_g1~~TRINITY_DN1442_c0_g1_i1.p1  ORF type:complete len:947 (+),score=364.09 TRINITY_DN1442_c0_g1_i1:83-2923(+)